MRFRLSALLLAAALALSCAGLVWASGSVGGQADDVVLMETLLAGDNTAVQGVTVDLTTMMDGQLRWQTRYTAGPAPTAHTDFTYIWKGKSTLETIFVKNDISTDDYIGRMRMDFLGFQNFRNQDPQEEIGLRQPLEDVASRCPAGAQDYRETVYLKDYYEELRFYVSQSGALPAGFSEHYSDPNGEGILDAATALRELLQETFRLPVPEDAALEVTVSKSEDGAVTDWEGVPVGNALTPEVSSVTTEEGVFFTFSAAYGEEPLDFSRSEMGRGVYFLPVERIPIPEDQKFSDEVEEVTPVLHTENFTLVVPIAQEAEQARLWASPDGQWLYLVVREGRTWTLTVLSTDKRDVVSRCTLFSGEAAQQELEALWAEDGYLLCALSEGSFSLVSVGEDGQARAVFSDTLAPVWEKVSRWDTVSFAFDGQRLALAGKSSFSVDTVDMDEYFSTGKLNTSVILCSFDLAVYDGEGLAYLATLLHNQDLGNTLGSSGCDLTERPRVSFS